MNLKQILLNETKLFFKNNSWVFFIFIVALSLIVYYNTWNLWDILLIFVANVVWDTLTMVMNSCYADKKVSEGSFLLLLSTLIFTTMSLYSFVFQGQVHYLLSELAFLLWWIKRFLEDTKWKKINYFWLKSIFILNFISLIIVCYMVFVDQTLWYSSIIIFMWWFFTSVFLVLENLKIKYYGSTFWQFLFAIWASIAIYHWLLNKNIIGMDLSCALFSFTVFISFLKDWNKFKAMPLKIEK